MSEEKRTDARSARSAHERAGPDDEGPPGAKGAAAYATTLLVALNVGVALSMAAGGASVALPSPESLVVFGAVDARAVWQGEVWRLVTAMFVHVGLLHIGLNLWVLSQVGRVLEGLVGSSRFLLVYLVSGVFGFALSLLLRPGMVAGASGAIFGVTGGLLAVAGLARRGPLGRFLFAALLPFVAGTFAFGFLLPFVDNAAHLGGLVMGFLLGYGLLAGDRTVPLEVASRDFDGSRERRLGSAALVAAVLLFVVVVPLSLRPSFSPVFHAQQGLLALSSGRLDEAAAHARSAERHGPEDAATLVLAARILAEQGGPGSSDRARALLEDALRATGEEPEAALARLLAEVVSPADPVGFDDAKTGAALCDAALALVGEQPAPLLRNNCAWLLLKSEDERVRDPRRALALASRAVREVGRRQPELLHTLAEARAQTGDPREAENILARLFAEGATGDPWLRAERRRFRALAEEAEARATTGPELTR